MRIAYLCSLFPAVSHTFVLREVEGLRRLGVEVHTFSIHRAGREHLLSEADRAAHRTTYAILPARWARLLATHLRLAGRSTRAYLSTLALALRLAPAGLRGLLWQIFYFAEAVELWRECRHRGVRHIHVHMGNVGADAALLAAALGSSLEPARPWSWSLSLHGPDELFDVRRFRLAEKVSRAEFVRCISDFTSSQLMTLSDPEHWPKLRVVHVGIPLDQFTRTNGGAPDDALARILFVGRHVPQKGHVTLLQATALLAERGHDVELILAGDGPLRPTLEALAERWGIERRVSFPGAVGQEQIHALYAAATIFCLPSFAEGLPTVLMEAMAMELPVVSTRINGVPELVEDGRTGLLVTPARADQLAGALERLIGDPARRRSMGAAARRVVAERFDVEQSAERLRRLFAEFADERGAR